jgi:hypothetical protein
MGWNGGLQWAAMGCNVQWAVMGYNDVGESRVQWLLGSRLPRSNSNKQQAIGI